MGDSSDFPAAHSMDTLWFAIDRDGHVALFDSCEGGAVPYDGSSDEPYEGDRYAVTEKLVDALAGAAPRVVPAEGVHALGPHGTFVMRAAFDAIAPFASNVQRRPDGMLVVLFGAMPPRPAFSLRRLFGGKPKVESAQPLFERAHEAGVCKGCCVDETQDDGLEIEELVERFGLFQFEGPRASQNRTSRARTRDAARRRAYRGARQVVREVRGLLRRQPILQPFEHRKDVQSWSASWVSTDGKVRCAPGREKDYAKEYPDLMRDFENVEPPKQ